jgi:hypothetical protein
LRKYANYRALHGLTFLGWVHGWVWKRNVKLTFLVASWIWMLPLKCCLNHVLMKPYFCLNFYLGRHECVSLINNFVSMKDLEYYTKVQGRLKVCQ